MSIDPAELSRSGASGDYARAGFGRGLCVDPDSGVIIAGSSPGTVTAYDPGSGRMLRSVRVTNDIRNAPHGLEVFPFEVPPA